MIKKYTLLLFLLCLVLAVCQSCEKPKGCTSAKALNYDSEAEKDDGTCTFSKVVFYQKYNSFNGIPIVKGEVSVDGNLIGTTAASYSNEPGNCSAVGTVPYTFKNDVKQDWNAKIFLQNGTILLGSGTLEPRRSEECIKINITQ